MQTGTRISLATIAVGLLLSTPAVGQEIDVEYDKFTDTTTVSTGQAQDRNPFAMVAHYNCPGDQLCRPANVWVLFGKGTDELTYQNEPTVIFLLDGQTRLRANQVTSDRSYESGTWLEFVQIGLAPEELGQVAGASQVEYQIGNTEGSLTELQIGKLERLHAKIDSASNR